MQPATILSRMPPVACQRVVDFQPSRYCVMLPFSRQPCSWAGHFIAVAVALSQRMSFTRETFGPLVQLYIISAHKIYRTLTPTRMPSPEDHHRCCAICIIQGFTFFTRRRHMTYRLDTCLHSATPAHYPVSLPRSHQGDRRSGALGVTELIGQQPHVGGPHRAVRPPGGRQLLHLSRRGKALHGAQQMDTVGLL